MLIKLKKEKKNSLFISSVSFKINVLMFFTNRVLTAGRSDVDGLPGRNFPVRGVRGLGRHLRVYPRAHGGTVRLPAHAASALVRIPATV